MTEQPEQTGQDKTSTGWKAWKILFWVVLVASVATVLSVVVTGSIVGWAEGLKEFLKILPQVFITAIVTVFVGVLARNNSKEQGKLSSDSS